MGESLQISPITLKCMQYEHYIKFLTKEELLLVTEELLANVNDHLVLEVIQKQYPLSDIDEDVIKCFLINDYTGKNYFKSIYTNKRAKSILSTNAGLMTMYKMSKMSSYDKIDVLPF
jgi:hypothetical protein